MSYDPDQVYYWRQRQVFADRYGQPCRVLSTQGPGRVTIEFLEDRLRACVAWVGLRKTPPSEWSENHRWEPSPEEIKAECAKIQSTWEHLDGHHAGGRTAPTPWRLPEIHFEKQRPRKRPRL